jgi:hypothetical protein
MKILYLSCHEILEYDELKLLSELGHEVYSLGAYTMPGGQENRKRPPLPKLPYRPHFIELATRYNQDNIHPEMLEMVDAVIIMHVPEWIEKNWPVFEPFIKRGGRVIWRSIGQSTPSVENRLRQFKDAGMQVVRYSPKEETIKGQIGCDAMIRFGKDPDEFNHWNGAQVQVINFTQSMLQRAKFCGWDVTKAVTRNFPVKIFGPGNEDLGRLNGGLLNFEDQKQALRDNRVYFYHGTYPASYTLSFIEAWMTGIPMVAVGPAYGNGRDFPNQDTYEIQDFISNGINGFCSDDIDAMQEFIKKLLNDHEFAKQISFMGRQRAIEIFNVKEVKDRWSKFLTGEPAK